VSGAETALGINKRASQREMGQPASPAGTSVHCSAGTGGPGDAQGGALLNCLGGLLEADGALPILLRAMPWYSSMPHDVVDSLRHCTVPCGYCCSIGSSPATAQCVASAWVALVDNVRPAKAASHCMYPGAAQVQ
jgi:hypothetical protein